MTSPEYLEAIDYAFYKVIVPPKAFRVLHLVLLNKNEIDVLKKTASFLFTSNKCVLNEHSNLKIELGKKQTEEDKARSNFVIFR